MLNPTYATPSGTTPRRRGATAGASSNAIASILTADDVLLGLDVSSKHCAFAEIARFVGARHGLPVADVLAGLDEREELGSTAIGLGVAIPHARVRTLTQPIAAFVRLKWAIPFDAPDGKPVTDVLALLVPYHANDAHLLLLAQVAEMFCDKAFRESLRSCDQTTEVQSVFARWRQA